MEFEAADRIQISNELRDAEARRGFLARISTLAMLGGLTAGYGTFFSMAVRYLFPARRNPGWHFVAEAARLGPGDSLLFTSPAGVPVVIRRGADREGKSAPIVADFVALSSTCPHLGCRVHWESVNNRFFCPCHNGSFDPDGNPTGGPVLAANQHLPRYPVRIDRGLLFIQMASESVGETRSPQVAAPSIEDDAPDSPQRTL